MMIFSVHVAGSVHSVAEALLLLLESTSEPLIPYNLHNICISCSNNYTECRQLIMQLPEYRKNVFLYLCTFLHELLSHSNVNELDTRLLGKKFPRSEKGGGRERECCGGLNFHLHFFVFQPPFSVGFF